MVGDGGLGSTQRLRSQTQASLESAEAMRLSSRRRAVSASTAKTKASSSAWPSVTGAERLREQHSSSGACGQGCGAKTR